jgi:hypothetical protein
MIRIRETFREMGAYGVCAAAVTMGLCACTQTTPTTPTTSTKSNTAISSQQQGVGMDEVVIIASRHSGPTSLDAQVEARTLRPEDR